MSIRYSKDHEYVRVEGTVGTVGISEFAQEQLGDIVFVELPEVGTEFEKDDEAAVIESVKAASEVYAPVSGKVIEVNSSLGGNPGQVNSSAEDEGWIFKLALRDSSELDGLMDAAAYAEHTK